jgi:hypothetical protein
VRHTQPENGMRRRNAAASPSPPVLRCTDTRCAPALLSAHVSCRVALTRPFQRRPQLGADDLS